MFEMKSSDSEISDSEEELQDAFKKGLLKPGLNVPTEDKKKLVNKVSEMMRKLNDIKLELNWVERLDLVNGPAALAPELAVQMKELEQKRDNVIKNNKKLPQISVDEDRVVNDFKREIRFYQEAQAAVLDGLERLKKAGIPTKRPEDYFAEMAKTDVHMQKVRESLLKKQAEVQRSERVKQLRAQRKMGKVIQTQARLQKAEEKRELLTQVKKYRKGLRNDLDFLENGKNQKNETKKSLEKKKFKNTKFGFGGRKKGSKRNTKDSSSDVGEYKRPGKPNTINKNKPGRIQRLGKNRRQKMKNNKSKGKKR